MENREKAMGKRILITAPVRQTEEIFKEYLWSLNRLIIPDNYNIDKYFYLHNSDYLKKFLQPNEYELINDNSIYEYNNRTHIWKTENFKAVAIMRTMALEKARKEKYDYIFSVDSDVILKKTTLIELLNTNKKFISKIFWNAYDELMPDLLVPNCYDGRLINQQMILDYEKLKENGIFKTGVIGACTLISNEIFNNEYINYYPIKNLSSSEWEYYDFCIRLQVIFKNKIKAYIDTNNPVKTLYRMKNYNNWIKKEKKQWEKEF